MVYYYERLEIRVPCRLLREELDFAESIQLPAYFYRER